MTGKTSVYNCDVDANGLPQGQSVEHWMSLSTEENLIVLRHIAPIGYLNAEQEFKEVAKDILVMGTLGSNNEVNSPANSPQIDAIAPSVFSFPILEVPSEDSLVIETFSKVDSFAFESEKKQISFTVSGDPEVEGVVMVNVGKFLGGPYFVLLDGLPHSNTFVDGEGTDSKLMIIYEHSTHEITITGTNVVPEFPVPILAIAAVIGVVAILGRTRMFNPF